jgi:hypothetical protein
VGKTPAEVVMAKALFEERLKMRLEAKTDEAMAQIEEKRYTV